MKCCNEKIKLSIALGIDFGTTNCLVAYSENGDQVELLDNNNSFLIPSIIAYQNNNYSLEENDGIKSIKRIIGLNLEEIKKYKLPYKIDYANSTNDSIRIFIENESRTVEEIVCGMMLCLKNIINNKFPSYDINAVITVPAYFDEKARGVIKKTAILAGISVIRLINEPTSAALAYSEHLENNKNYLIYDLGGGTFDISILKKYPSNFFRVIGIGGDKYLGGDDFDHILSQSTGLTLEKAKVLKESGDYEEIKFRPIIHKTIDIMHKVISEANVEIEAIILVGGATRLQLIHKMLKETFPKQMLFSQLNPDEIVARGAAIHAHSLINKTKQHMLIDAISLSLGIEIAAGGVEILIPKNSPIPISRTQIFTTQIDNQTQMRIAICQGESSIFAENILLGKFSLNDLLLAKAGSLQIEITFAIDADGILSVTAKEAASGQMIFIANLKSIASNHFF